MNTKKQKLYKRLWYLCVFSFMYIWFTQIHPLVVYDADDWTYISYVRTAIPLWGNWNPSRVFPEIFMPFCSRIAVYVLAPLIGNYLQAITIVSALVVSAFITLYLFCFAGLLKRLFSPSPITVFFLSFLFLTLHFLALRGASSDNTYLFYCHDLTCYYYYLIPALINASIVMSIIENKRFESLISNGSPAQRGIAFLVLYMAIFSNLIDSMILAVYSGSVLLISMFEHIRRKWRLWTYIKANLFHITVLFMWLISAVYELYGGRASANLGYSLSLTEGIRQTIIGAISVVYHCNRAFINLGIGIVLATGVVLIRFKIKDSASKKFFHYLVVFLICGIAMLIFLFLLCAKVDAEYIYRSDYLFGLFFYCFIILLISLSYIIKVWDKAMFAIPILLCVLLSTVNTSGQTFKESNSSNLDKKTCMEVGNNLIEQIVQADRIGANEMTLYVPKYDRSDNWPHALFLGGRISTTLYEHGIINHPIEIVIEPSEYMNERYNIG